MTETTEIVPTKEHQVTVVSETTPATLLAMAVQQGADMDKLEKIKPLWRPVVGYEGLYSVSNRGSVRSENRKVRDGARSYFKKGRVLLGGGGAYRSVVLCNGVTQKTFAIHTLVANAFLDKRGSGVEVMHLNGDKHDNRVENLRYGSRSCNFAFKVDDCTDTCGESHPASKLTKKEVIKMRWLWRLRGHSYAKLAKLFSVSAMTAFRATNKQCWRSV